MDSDLWNFEVFSYWPLETSFHFTKLLNKRKTSFRLYEAIFLEDGKNLLISKKEFEPISNTLGAPIYALQSSRPSLADRLLSVLFQTAQLVKVYHMQFVLNVITFWVSHAIPCRIRLNFGSIKVIAIWITITFCAKGDCILRPKLLHF